MPPNKHATLGASGAHRWMECPGSVRLSEGIEEGPPSEYAVRGSLAHAVGEYCLRDGRDPFDMVGEPISHFLDSFPEDMEDEVVTENMASAVSVYVDYVLSIPHEIGEIEARFNLGALDPPAPMFGTADYAAWDPESRTLDVIDYKHGRGVVVEVEDNPQLLYYALGAVLHLRVKPDTIRLHVVQPRADHPDGPIRTWEFGWDTLIAFKEELMESAREAVQPDAPVGPVGDHCRWCPAKAICPAQQQQALDVVQQEFAMVDEETLPAPTELTLEEIVDVLEVSGDIEDWFKSLRSYAKTLLEQGEEVPGWKLVDKRAYRRWRDDEEAEEWLRKRFNVGDIFNRKLVSPYQAEQLLKDRPRTELPEDFIIAESSGTNLVPESNPRPAVQPAQEVIEAFDAEEVE